jgi:hypothetical protein
MGAGGLKHESEIGRRVSNLLTSHPHHIQDIPPQERELLD